MDVFFKFNSSFWSVNIHSYILVLSLWECLCVYVFKDGPVPVSQRRDDQPFSAAQEFILVDKAHVCDVDDHLIWVFIEVETALLQPLKVVGAFDMESALEGEWVGMTVRRDKEKKQKSDER